MASAIGLRHPASASCLGRHVRLAGRCPNNSSLFPPLAAVVVVALWPYSAERLFLIEQSRSVCGRSAIPFSRVGSPLQALTRQLPQGGAFWHGGKVCGLTGKFLPAFSVQRRSAGPEAGRGVPTPPSLPLDSTHPATGQGLLALDDPKEEVEAQKS